jgi:hypothetical protein
MLSDVNALPRAERHFAAGDGYVQGDAVDHRFDMRGHIVGSFGIMNPAGVVGRNALERRDEVGLHLRIGVFLNDKRRRGVPQIKQHDAIARFDLAQEARDLSRYFKKTFAGGFDRERRAGDGFDTRRRDGGQFGGCAGQRQNLGSGLVQQVLLSLGDCVDEPLPDLSRIGDRATDIGIVGQLDRDLIAVRPWSLVHHLVRQR